nr:universal stress protein [Rhodococcus sp. (in: high G+C Gram-positive bacteria)]
MKLTVGYLATPSGDDGVALAAVLASALDASIDIVIVLRSDEPVMEGSGPYRKILDAKAAQWLSAARDRVPAGTPVTTRVAYHESFAQGLIDVATAEDSDMIVVGGAGDGLLDRHTIGTVAAQLLHASPVPLALAPRGYRSRQDLALTGLTVAIPTRPGAADPSSFAITIASAAHLPLRLVSLVSLEDTQADGRALDTRKRNVAAAEANLDDAMRKLPGIDGLESVVADGSNLDEAVSSLQWRDGDVLILGSSRLAAPKRVFLGSSAAKIVRATPAPVIVVPHD